MPSLRVETSLWPLGCDMLACKLFLAHENRHALTIRGAATGWIVSPIEGSVADSMFLAGPIAPTRARFAKTFPVGDWVYEPKWDGFRCVLFRHGADVHLQSRAMKDLTRGFPEVVAAARTADEDSFVLDGELAIPSPSGFSFDFLVNRLRLRANSERFRREVAQTPAIYIVFDMLAGRESLLEQPFRQRR